MFFENKFGSDLDTDIRILILSKFDNYPADRVFGYYCGYSSDSDTNFLNGFRYCTIRVEFPLFTPLNQTIERFSQDAEMANLSILLHFGGSPE